MTTINHEHLESLARQLWAESPRAKAKTWETAKRNHWRRKALSLATMASERPSRLLWLMRACGWRV